MKTLNLFISVVLFLLVGCSSEERVVSQDGRNSITLSLDESGQLNYSIYAGQNQVVYSSPMGLQAKDVNFSFDKGLEFIGEESSLIDEIYTLPSGKRSVYINKAVEKRFTYKNKANNLLHVVCRAYNDGIAFRYEIENRDSIVIQKELTKCILGDQTRTWMMKGVNNYECFFPERSITTLKPQEKYLFPVLTLNQNQWMLMTEANVFSIPAMQLEMDSKSSTFQFVYPQEDKEFKAAPNFRTSWKTFIMGAGLKDIVESTLVENLNPPVAIEDIDWIKPGVAVFPWWGNVLANSYIDTLKMYVDLASDMKWEWLEFDVSLVNSPFNTSKDWMTADWIPELTSYARQKNVQVYGWDEYKILNNKEGRDYVLGRYVDMNIDGIKIDFIGSDSKRAMDFRETVTREAARRKLLVSFHGETLPRGQRRTFPNIMTHEGVRGAEYYILKGQKPANSRHNCTLPFTRNVVGPMDYTPATFTIREENPRTTTYAHELALPFVFESGWICMADRPAAYLNSPARPVLEKLEAAWDDIHFIDGFPGEYACLARCKKGKWFVAAINSETERTIKVPLDFLPKGKHAVVIYRDKKENVMNDVTIEKLTDLTEESILEVKVAPHGGFVIDID